MNETQPDEHQLWQTVERPGYQGKKKDEQIQRWNTDYGEGNWRIAWELKNRLTFNYEQVFYNFYVPGYMKHFLEHPEEAEMLTTQFSYAYDKDLISKTDAFDPYALFNKPGRPNQFHNVALNIALEWYMGMPFQGDRPIQVREGKPGTDVSEWPEGWQWSPGRIDAVRQDLIPENNIEGWWRPGTIEDVYQTAKVVQIKHSRFTPIYKQG